MSAQSYRNLKQQVVELVAVNEALSEKIAAFIMDHEATVEGFINAAVEQGKQLADALSERDYWAGIYKTVAGERTALKSEVEEKDKRIFSLSEQLTSCRMAVRATEAQRDHARAQAEAMRFHAFPIPPTFEWERPQSLQELQNFDPVTRMRNR